MLGDARASRRLVVTALTVVALLAIVSVGYVRGWGTAGAPADSAAEPPDPLTAALDRLLLRDQKALPGLAIRPLADATAQPDVASLADAVCASLVDRLARLPMLRVVPCRSTQVAAAAELDDRRLARLLAVGYVLKGRLHSLPGERLRVQLALHEVARDRDAWRIDEEIAVAALQQLPARVSQETGAALGQPDPTPPETAIPPAHYAQFVLARQLAGRVSIEDKRRALALLDEVIAAVPDHVPSLYLRQSVRGSILGNMADKGHRPSVAELNAERAANVEQGRVLARRLVAADPADYRGQFLLLADEIEFKQWAQGFQRLDGMIARHAHLPGALTLAARLHMHAGYIERARELALAAARLNALDANAIELLASVAGIRAEDATLRELLSIARQIGHQGLGPLEVFEAFRRADWPALERAHVAYVAWGGQWSADWVPAYVRGLADPGLRDTAVRLLDGHDDATRQHFASYYIEYALLGDVERSLGAVRHHSRMAPASWMQRLWWPEMAAVRRHPQFAQAMKDLGAVALWEARGAPDLCSRGADGNWACR